MRPESVFRNPSAAIKRGKNRKPAEGEIDLGDRPCGSNVANTQSKSGIKLRGIEQFEEGTLGIDAGDNRFDGNLFAIV